MSPPPPPTGMIVHQASGLCLTVGRCAAPPPPLPPDAALKGTHPCDIYQSSGHPCVAAHSMVRALYADYSGPLYNVIRASDNATATVKVLAAGGYANSSGQDSFCAGSDCVVSQIFDQSPNSNHLPIFNYTTPARKRLNKGVNATRDKHMVGGHPVYAAYFEPGDGYRTLPGPANGTAVGHQSESMYAVFSGRHYNDRCCFDYGNAESNAGDDGDGTMEAIYFGNDIGWNREGSAQIAKNKTGPWIGADIENGMCVVLLPTWLCRSIFCLSAHPPAIYIYIGVSSILAFRCVLWVDAAMFVFDAACCLYSTVCRYEGDDFIDWSTIPTWNIDYVTSMLKGRVCEFALKGGDASHAGGNLTTLYDGVRPQHNNYNPMKLQGSIILGTGYVRTKLTHLVWMPIAIDCPARF